MVPQADGITTEPGNQPLLLQRQVTVSARPVCRANVRYHEDR